jgi:hypothetical protein
MKRMVGIMGALTWIGVFFALAVGNAAGDDIAAALNRLADAWQPTPTPTPMRVVTMSVSHAAGDSPVLVFLVLAGLLLGGIGLCVWLRRRAHPHLLPEETA